MNEPNANLVFLISAAITLESQQMSFFYQHRTANLLRCIVTSIAVLSLMNVPTDAADKSPVPNDDKLAPAETLVRKVFVEDFKTAKTRENKLALANKLLEVAKDTNDNPAGKFVLMRTARVLAIDAGDVDQTWQAIDVTEASFAVDALAL